MHSQLWTKLRRGRYLLGLGLTSILLLSATLGSNPTRAATVTPASLSGAISWDSDPEVISTGDERSGFPRVAVDSNNVTHAIYATEDGRIMYTNNASGSYYRSGTRLAGGTYGVSPAAAIGIGLNNSVHVVYARLDNNDNVYYQRSNDDGATWSSAIKISGGSKATDADLAMDPDTGDAHITWLEKDCDGEYRVRYRVVYNNGNTSSAESPKTECSVYQNRPAITFANGMPHIVYQRDVSKNAEIYYGRRESSGTWVRENVSNTGSVGSQNPTIASDGNKTLYVAWDENNNNHDIIAKVSFDGGQTWSSKINISTEDEWASQPYVSWGDSTQRFHVVWSDMHDSDDGEEEVWERQFDPVSEETTAPDRVSHFGRHSYWPAISVGPARASMAWHDNVDGTYQIWDWDGDTIASTEPQTGCDGALTLSNSNGTLTGTITPTSGCTPDEMQISLNSAVSDSTAKQTYSSTFTLTADSSVCTQTVYVRLLRNSYAGTDFSASVVTDTSVDASVSALNPHLGLLPATSGTAGASDGAPGYTRESQYYLQIDDTGDCAGLSSFSITSGNSGSFSDTDYLGLQPLANLQQGTKSIDVQVTDAAGNKASYTTSIVYDTTAPVLDTTENPTATLPISSSTVMTKLTLDNISVDDNLYGTQGTYIDPGKRYWGIVAANSTSDVGADSSSLTWLPVQVANPSSTVTLNWNLISGLSSVPSTSTGGTIYVYIRFIDGAGNISSESLATGKITLAPNYSLPKTILPIVLR